MIFYRVNQFLSVFVSICALALLAKSQNQAGLDLRLALLIYSSLLIATVSTFAKRNLVGQLRYRRFGALLLLTAIGIYLVFGSTNLLFMGIGWSLSGVGATLLVNHANNRKSRRAMLGIGSWFLISDIAFWSALLIAHFNHINLFASVSAIGENRSTLYNGLALLIAIAGIIRSGIFPAMRWLILTSEAPSPLSAFLHAGIVNGFGYLLVVFPIIHRVRIVIVIFALITIFLALSIMRHRHDEKGKLANGTSMQMAFMALEGILGVPGIVLLHIIGHGSYKSWSFLRAGGAPLRKKNAIPLSLESRSRGLVIPLLAVLYAASVASAVAWLGSEFLLNISVASVALASSLLFAWKLPRILTWQFTAISVLLFFVGMSVIRFVSEIFPKLWNPSTFLVASLAIMIIFMTAILRITPRIWTLQLASRANNYVLSRRKLRHGLWKLRKGSLATITEEKVKEIVAAVSSPFGSGMALSRIVAQDSLPGLHHLDFHSAAELAQGYGISLYSSSGQYLSWLEQGVISREVLTRCLANSDLKINLSDLIDRTNSQAQLDRHKLERTSAESPVHTEQIAVQANWWCSQSWHDGAIDPTHGAYELWRATLPKRQRELMANKPMAALMQILPILISSEKDEPKLADSQLISMLQSLIALDISWFLYSKGLGKEAEVSLLALRAGLLLFSKRKLGKNTLEVTPHVALWQLAMEQSFSDNLKSEIKRSNSLLEGDLPAQVSIVTCIDVRSDVLRSKAEETPGVRTVGMAGFFGIDLCINHYRNGVGGVENFAPIIVEPSLGIVDQRRLRFLWALPSLWKSAVSGSGALAIAEGFGIINGLLSAINTFLPSISKKLNQPFDSPRWLDATGSDLSSLSESQKIEYASSILSVISPATSEEVIFVGHGADASNTPFRSMYECGACGGNNGALNARFAANLMNDATVQSILRNKYSGKTIRFYAAEHNTTAATFSIDPMHSDEVATYSSPTLSKLISEVSTLPKREFPTSPLLIAGTSKTSSAWWQVFPEWGLSGNAACVIGPRELTRNLNLRSRVFLHDYAWESDLDGQLLKTILAGPGVVMQMINSAYNITITSPHNFSSGDKTRHNVLGEAGVLLGAEGPLLRGMPWQAISPHFNLAAGESEGHIPIRLQIFIAAPDFIIDQAISQTDLAPLVSGGWIAVHCLNAEGSYEVQLNA
jgi:NADH:ubiquinone oxidoreductase subunit 5 (subunit L)/multisubunit Na+/H+ antiporter MnhA subunit